MARISESDPTHFAFVALSIAAFLVNLDRAIFAPLLPALASDLHTNVGIAGQAVTAYVLPYGLFQVFYGPLADRAGKVHVVRWAVLFFAVGTGLCSLASNLTQLFALRALTGACAAAVIPLALAFIGDAVPYERRQQAIATLMSTNALGGVLSTAVGGVVGDVFSWRVLFAGYGIASLASVAMLFKASGSTAMPSHAAAIPASQRYGRVLREGNARWLYVLVAAEGLFVNGAFTYVGSALRDRFAISYLVIGLVLACYGAGTFITSRFLRRLVQRFRERGLLIIGGPALACGFLLLVPLPAWILATIPILLLGFGFATFHTTLQTRATELVPALRGTSVALFAFSLFLGGAAGTALFGWMYTAIGPSTVFVTACAGMVVVTLAARLSW